MARQMIVFALVFVALVNFVSAGPADVSEGADLFKSSATTPASGTSPSSAPGAGLAGESAAAGPAGESVAAGPAGDAPAPAPSGATTLKVSFVAAGGVAVAGFLFN